MPLLSVSGLEAFYDDFQALFGLDIEVSAGESVALVGANGAGKTTFFRCLTGLLTSKRGAIVLDGEELSGAPAEHIAHVGVALAPEGRKLFSSLSVEENLKIGAFNRRPGYWNLARVYEHFPLLLERRTQRPDTLSGGQQGLAAIGRALMANPKLLLCDEISLGLAPAAVEQIYASLDLVRSQGTSIVLVEQDVRRAAAAADRIYCLLEGCVSFGATTAELDHNALARAYFGADAPALDKGDSRK
jgi:branched-chain amino acid transport system ATP-binding protein